MKSQMPVQPAPNRLPNTPDARMTPRRGGAWLKMATAAVWVLVVVIIFKTWFVAGLFQPLVVPGGSMAQTLLGTHRTVVCDDCGFRFHCGSDLEPVGRLAVCPNCGFAENDLAALDDVWGDRVLVHKSVFFFRRPRPWEVVAFRDPAQADRIMVKRVVGLPGETISLRDGDVYVDGKIRRKPPWLQRAMAVLIHDSGYSSGRRDSQNVELEAGEPATKAPRVTDCRVMDCWVTDCWVTDHWVTDDREEAWGFADGRFAHPAGTVGGTVDWLTFCPGRPVKNRPGKWIPPPVTDICGYNQTRPRRVEDIHAVDDLMLSLRVLQAIGHGSMLIRISDARSEFLIRCTVGRPNENGASPRACELQIDVWRDGKPLDSPNGWGQKTVSLPDGFGFAPRGVAFEASLFDRRLLVSIDGQEIVNHPYEPCPASPTKSAENRPLAIGSDGLGLVLDEVRVYRDVYYAAPPEVGRNPQVRVARRLGGDEYFVLGDNSPISVDSRNWGPNRAVSHKLLLGKPLAIHFPSTIVDIGGYRFQVPNISRIRYIR